jgi:zeaxanthin glucosyltransferase
LVKYFDIDAISMRSILILLSPAFGHYHATYKIATQLKERGYSVVYAGEGSYKESVMSHGFGFWEFSFGDLVRDRYGKARYFQLCLVRYFLVNLFKNSSRKMYKDYVAASERAKEIVTAIDPALIVLDVHISTLYLFLIQTGRPCFQICTTLSTNRVSMVPPITSGFIPKETFVSKCLTALLWTKHSLQNKIDYLFQKGLYTGKDNDCFLRKFAKVNGIRHSFFGKNK